MWSNWSLRLKWLILSAFITSVCVLAGGFILKELTEQERKFSRMGPHEHHFGVMQELVLSGKFSPEEAFRIVEQNHSRRGPGKSFLLNSSGKVVASHPANEKPAMIDAGEKQQLGNHFVVYERPSKKDGIPGHPGKPPEGARFIILVTVCLSIFVGLALSILFLTIFIRKKSLQAEDVIQKLKTGDLKARFNINDIDESSLLMVRFNEMADQIENLVTNLRNTEQARMIMLQELAHDLRTPVASLKQFQEILIYKGHLLDDEKRKQTQLLALKEISYFERLVEDLLFLSGVNDPRYSASFKNVSVNELISEETENFSSDKISVNVTANDSLIVQGDSHLLKRLFRNAISNAVRFAETKVEIRLSRNNGFGIIEIMDDGPGMKDEDLKGFGEKKFSRQFDSNISIGLGSVIMKKITSLHDGHLNVQNQSISGLHVTIKLPMS